MGETAESDYEQHITCYTGVAETTLNDIANAIGNNPDRIYNLGVALDITYTQIQQYVKANGQNCSLEGTRMLLITWKYKTHPKKQNKLLAKALQRAGLTEVAESFFARLDKTCSGDLRCRVCKKVVANVSKVINNKSSCAVYVYDQQIQGRTCRVHLLDAFRGEGSNRRKVNHYDVIVLKTANVSEWDKIYGNSFFEGTRDHKCCHCECGTQLGWYYIPLRDGDKPFYGLWLQALIFESYVKNRNQALKNYLQEDETGEILNEL